jgi:hypothetical protein
MSPTARKFEQALSLPTIATGLMVLKQKPSNDYQLENLLVDHMTVAHNAKISVNLLKDWMEFTHVLGNGILSKIS